MIAVDSHVHSLGVESVDIVLKSMDSARIDRAVIFSPYPSSLKGGVIPKASAGVTQHLEFSYPDVTVEKQMESVEFVAGLQREAPDRIISFVWLEPRLKDSVQISEWGRNF